MKKIVLLLTIILMSFPKLTRAAHIIGGEISYRCFGNGDYQVIIKMYRDCYGGGAGFDSNDPDDAIGQVTIYRGNASLPFQSVVLDPPKVTRIDPELGEGCRGRVPDLCVEEGVYTFSVNLPVSAETYHITYQRCCRNNTISNIYDPGETGATYTVAITREAQRECNHGPEFKDFPPIAICANEPLDFDHGAFDTEGDSLVYEFCSPLQGGHLDDLAPNPDAPPPYTNVAFIPPRFTARTPLAGDPLIIIDRHTGLISGTPTTLGQFVVGICVREYRNGLLLSVVQRDFQFNVVDCHVDVVADLDGLTKGDKHFFYELCEGDTLQMRNESYEEANINSYHWAFEPGVGPGLSAERDLTIPELEAGNYHGQMVLNPGLSCTDTAFFWISVNPTPKPEMLYDYDSCQVGPVRFVPDADSSQTAVQGYHWTFGDGGESREVSPQHQYVDRGSYEVVLSIADENGCTGSVVQRVDWLPHPPIPFEPPLPAEGCAPLTIHFDQLQAVLDEGYEVSWEFGDGNTAETIAPSHTYEQAGRYDLEISISSAEECDLRRTFPEWIVVEDPPVADFMYLPQGRVNKKEAIAFQNLSLRTEHCFWTFGDGSSSTSCDSQHTFQQTGEYKVQLVAEHALGCLDSMALTLEVRPVYRIYVPNAFSPNEDDVNDQFRAYVYCPLEQFEMKIFDRWGQQVFESHDVARGWDGWKGNEGFQPGVYAWVITYWADGRMQLLSGDVTLVE